jgi:hypothetical protein
VNILVQPLLPPRFFDGIEINQLKSKTILGDLEKQAVNINNGE